MTGRTPRKPGPFFIASNARPLNGGAASRKARHG